MLGAPRLLAMTVTELLVSVSIMTVLVYGLYSMFAHTQKALKANLTQVDISETGRAVSELLSAELAEMAACNLSNKVNLAAWRTFTAPTGAALPPLRQLDVNEIDPLRTNVLQEIYFLSTLTNLWTAIGYRVMDAADGVGTLYRFSASARHTTLAQTPLDDLRTAFQNTWFDASGRNVSTNLHRVADGIIHFRLIAYDSQGLPLKFPYNGPAFQNYSVASLTPTAPLGSAVNASVVVRPDALPFPNQTEFLFLNNALPSYVELELGVLDPGTLQQYQSVKGTALAAGFLQKRAGRVQLTRVRIPIRNAAP